MRKQTETQICDKKSLGNIKVTVKPAPVTFHQCSYEAKLNQLIWENPHLEDTVTAAW